MVFNKKSCVIVYLLISMQLLIGCDDYNLDNNEYIIGNPLDNVSSLSDTNNLSVVSLFDKATKRIHSFNVNTLEIMQSHKVLNPESDHYIIASRQDSYLVDLSESMISIFRPSNQRSDIDMMFNGQPVSSAYNEINGFVVVYDDLQSVSIIKLSNTGSLIKQWTGGSVVTGDSTILSGDISEDGKLILSLSDGLFAVVDLEESIDQNRWVLTTQNTIDTDVKWLAPVSLDRIMYLSSTRLVLYDYSTQSEVSSIDTTNYSTRFYSKYKNPHVFFRNSVGNLVLAYSDGVNINIRELTQITSGGKVVQSTLDFVNNTFSIIQTKELGYLINNEILFINSSVFGRQARTFRFSDMLNLNKKDLPDKAQLKQADNFVFALFPSELGYAKKINLTSDNEDSVKLFNVPFIK